MKSKMTKIKYNGLIRRDFGVSFAKSFQFGEPNLNKYEVSNIKVISQEVFLSCIEGELLKFNNLKNEKGVGIVRYK